MSEPRRTSRKAKGLHHVALALFAVLLLGTLTLVDYLPTQDGPRALFFAWLDNHYDDPATHYRALLKPGAPATSLGFQLIFSSLESLLPWRTALRLTLGIIGLSFGAAFYWLVRTLAPRRRVVGLLGFALAPQWALYMGFFSFTLATALSFVVLAVALRSWPWSSDRRFVIAIMLTLVAVADVFAALLLGLALACVVWARSKGWQRLREWIWLVAMALPLLAIVAVTTSESMALPAAEVTALPAMTFAERLIIWLRCFATGPWWRGGVVAALAIWSITAVLQKGRPAVERGLASAAVILLALGFALPLHSERWSWLAVRVLPLGFMLALALLPIERLSALRRRIASVGIALFGLASLGWAAWYNVSLRSRSEGFLAALDAPIKRRGPRLAIVLDTHAGDTANWREQQVPFSAPALNLGMLYATAQGGIPPYLAGDQPTRPPFLLSAAGIERYPVAPELSSVAAFDDSAKPDPAARHKFMRWVAFLGSSYEDTIVYGHIADFTPLKQAGYVSDFDNERLFIGHFVGCRAQLQVTGEASRIRFASGWPDVQHSTTERTVVPRKQPPYTIDIGALPCGRAWLQPAIEQGAQLHRCAEANEAGVYLFDLSFGRPLLIRCTPQ